MASRSCSQGRPQFDLQLSGLAVILTVQPGRGCAGSHVSPRRQRLPFSTTSGTDSEAQAMRLEVQK
jgi:hypothetical protein